MERRTRSAYTLLEAEPAKNIAVPLRKHPGGTLRVGGTRVSLDTVIGAFRDGATAEQIAQSYPALGLPDVYSVIAYYLTHREAVEAYLAERELAATRLRAEIEAEHGAAAQGGDTAGIRRRLLSRRGEHPPAG